MRRTADLPSPTGIEGIELVPYQFDRYHDPIPILYGEAFGEAPWTEDWDKFDEFDPEGVFLAIATQTQRAIAFIISFQRQDFGYISVVAVAPAHRRQGVATALIQRVAEHWRSKGLTSLRIDVYADNLAAVRAYETLGFRVYETREEVNGRDSASRDEVVRTD
jgi:ribosomal protein S18 acetylase RimI-like enzyme